MKIEELLLNNQIVNLGFSIIMGIYTIVFIIECILWNKRHYTAGVNSHNEETITWKPAIISIQALSVLAVYLMVYFTRLRFLVLLISLPMIMTWITSFLDGIGKLKSSIENDEQRLSLQTKASLMLVVAICYSIPMNLPSFIKNIVIYSDFYRIIIKILATSVSLFSIVCTTGLLFSELGFFTHGKNNWKKVYKFAVNSQFLRELTSEDLWNTITKYATNHNSFLRVLILFVGYIVCLLFNIFLTIVYMLQLIVKACILIFTYMLRFVEYLMDRIYLISDSRFVWASIRISIILSLIITKCTLIQSEFIQDSSREIFDFISEATLIPLIMAELLSIKERFKKIHKA